MTDISTITMHPGGTFDENQIVWNTVLDEARNEPGKLVTLIVNPGQYQLHDDGPYFIIGSPGMRVEIVMSSATGKLHIALSQTIPALSSTPGRAVQAENLFRGKEFAQPVFQEPKFPDTPTNRLEDERFTYHKPDMPWREGGAIV